MNPFTCNPLSFVCIISLFIMHKMVHTKWKFMVNLSADYKFMEILKFAEYILCLIILFVLKLINHKISVYTLACIT